jgi:hypothetical protein
VYSVLIFHRAGDLRVFKLFPALPINYIVPEQFMEMEGWYAGLTPHLFRHCQTNSFVLQQSHDLGNFPDMPVFLAVLISILFAIRVKQVAHLFGFRTTLHATPKPIKTRF